MKLIIDISEGSYNTIKECYERGELLTTICMQIATGTPYEERPQGDLISREALKKQFEDRTLEDFNCYHFIKAIDNAPTVEPFEPDYVGAERVKARQRGYEEGYHNGMEIGKTLNPKIKQGEWVSVNERLPEDRNLVLVTAYWHETYQVMQASYFGEGEKNGWWCVPWNNCGKHMRNDLHVIAWQLLPEPYKEGGAEC